MKRTGNSKLAVVGWGRGMGHSGHMYLADAVIQQAADMNADPYFFVSKTVGKDDPIYPEEKVHIYQAVFPKHRNIFMPQGNLNQALTDLAQMGYDGVIVVVGADQKQAFQYLEKPNKEGVPVYQSMGLKKLRVISRQETRSKFAKEEGPRATPMREILMNPNASEEDKFKVWRRDMPQALNDAEVLDLMHKAEQRMKTVPTKAKKLKEFITRVRPLLKEANTEHRLKILSLIKKSIVNEGFTDVVKGIKRKVAGKEDPKEVEHMYGRIARSAIKHKTPDQAEKDIKRWEKVNKVVNKESVTEEYEPGDKITWYHSNHFPEIEGTVEGWKDGHLIVKSVDPNPRNTEKTVARYRVPKNNILSHTKQGVEEAKSKAIGKTAKDLTNPPKVMQHRAQRDIEREKQYKNAQLNKDDSEDDWDDTESQQLISFAQQHYPQARTKQQAFIKYVQRALKHSEEEDKQQDQELEQIKNELLQLQQNQEKMMKVTESQDYLDEK